MQLSRVFTFILLAVALVFGGAVAGVVNAAEDAEPIEVVGRVISRNLSNLERQYDKVVHIEIVNFEYTPGEVVVEPGTLVIWTNRDAVQHNVDLFPSDANSLEKSVISPMLTRNGMWAAVFHEEGTYPYLCDPHDFMRGTVIVTSGN